MNTLASLALLLFVVNHESKAQTLGKVDDVYTTCFDATLHGKDPLRPECTKAFMQFAVDMKHYLNFTKEEINYLWSLERELQGQFQTHRRRKRQARGFLPIRRECRLMGEFQRWRLFQAINILKRQTSNPNVYDLIARLHFGATLDAHAHRGSNFLGWHRVFLVVYENALRRAVPGVALCFWDTTMEDRLGPDMWNQTAVFSSDFFGNGRGVVITGPFANWSIPQYPELLNTPLLPRSLGSFGGPVSQQAVNLIFYGPNSRSHTQVTVGGTGRDVLTIDGRPPFNVTIEGEHNSVHVFVGGAMWLANSAPQDPVFYLHHTYVDYMWEMFRRKMRRFFRDPTTDYPGHGISNMTLHAAEYPMIGFESLRNIDGYSDYFTQFLFQYESPSCGACFQSPWTTCNNLGQCVARINMPGTELVQGPEPGPPEEMMAVAFTARATGFDQTVASAGRRFPTREETD